MDMGARLGTLETVSGGACCAILPAVTCDPDPGGGAREPHPQADPAIRTGYVVVRIAELPAGELRGAARGTRLEWTERMEGS